jgi:PTH1 family peptidyl-tRNA hydrolase
MTHVRLGGSANGHNGIKSVISALRGDDNFWRIRVGIGKNEGVDTGEYVMVKLSAFEKAFWGVDGEGVDLVMINVGRVIKERRRKGR